MTSDKPLISICIPNYNNGPYLAQAIVSALQQTIQNIEVIVCDNQSTDNSLEVARSFTDSRVRVYSNERNLGIYGNFARTTELARGKYLKFLCADDWIEPDYLENSLAYFAKYPEAGLVTTRQIAITDEGVVTVIREEAVKDKEIYTSDEYFDTILRRMNPIGNPTRVIVPREVFDAVGGFDSRNEYAGDLDLWFRIAARYSIIAIPKALCYERKHPQQNTNQHMRRATDIEYICMAVEKNIHEFPAYWTLDRRIAYCRYALRSHIWRAFIARLQGNVQYWTNTMTCISEICPERFWLPYTLASFPVIETKIALLRSAKSVMAKAAHFRSK